MPSVKKEKEQAMASNIATQGAEEPEDRRPGPQPAARPEGKTGFFTIYKSGQGYWTRMASGAGALLVIALTVNFLWQQLPIWVGAILTPADAGGDPAAHAEAVRTAMARAQSIAVGLCVAAFVGLSALAWYLLNKPANAQFLIETDVEMKKVNWTSRKELIGSTKVVIIFMFFIAFALFAIDQVFHLLFWAFNVLKVPPFWWPGS